jgi:peptide/nickel transport system ATP-binding protein
MLRDILADSGASTTGQGKPPLLSVRELTKDFASSGAFALGRASPPIRAVAGVSFDVQNGETLGLVGESGCGKSTLTRCILRLLEPTSGVVMLDGVDLASLDAERMRAQRKHLQVVFQDPYASLHPRLRIRDIMAEPLLLTDLSRRAASDRVNELMELVKLDREHLDRFAHELSGGQRQRVGIARALSVDPKLILLDEPVSALDVSIQAGILNLLIDLQERLGHSYLFVAHNLSTVRHIADRVAVMYLGKIVEIAPTDELFAAPRHPYTTALLSAVPIPNPKLERRRKRIVLSGEIPSPTSPPSGCRFRTRCWKAQEICSTSEPQLRADGATLHACHFPQQA